MAERWHDKTAAEVEELTGSDIQNGLSPEIARERLDKNGRNDVFPIEHRSMTGYMADFSTNGLSLLLVLVSLISIFFKEYLLAISAVILIGVSYFVTFMAYYSSRILLERAARNSLPNAKVIRGGKLITVKQDEIVTGDVIQLSAGDIVPCDARIVSVNHLYIVETGITDGVGSIEKQSDFVEYRNVPPHMCFNMAWASTIVTKGSGRAIACEVGKNTLVRRTGKNKPAAEYHKLAIFDTLRKIGGKMSLFYIASAFIISLVGLMPFFGGNSLVTLLVALSLGAAGLSEFLMLFGYIIVACGLFDSLSRKKQTEKGSLIKNADRLDTLKKVDTVIIPPEALYSKRGMSLEKAYVSGTLYDASQSDFADNCLRLLKYAVVTTGLYGQNKLASASEDSGEAYTFEEDAILRAAFESGVYNTSLESEYPLIEFRRKNDYNRLDTALVRFNGDNTVLLRGEVNEVLSYCTHYYENGRIFRLGPIERSKIEVEATQLMRQAYRVVAVASKNSRFNSLTKLRDSQNDLIFEGFIALIEPILPGVSQTVARLRNAKMNVVLFCDDVSEKDYQIARAIGIVSSRENVITGEKLRELDLDESGSPDKNIMKYTMFEGMSVSDKELAIKKIKENGSTVAFLGNKLNEITLLKEADIGMTECLKLTGTNEENLEYNGCEALRFVSDAVVTMVDMDSSGGLNSVADVIGSAKNINNNIDRMLRYLISAQSIRAVIVLWSLLIGKFILSPLAILALGLVFDFFAALIMAFKKPTKRILRQKDRDISQKSIIKTAKDCIIKGALCGGFVLVISYLLVLFKLMPMTSFNASVFVSCVTMSASLMMLTLNDSRGVTSELRINRIQFFYLIAVLLFVGACVLFKPFTAVVTESLFVSRYIFLSALLSSVAAPIFSTLTLKFFGGKEFKKFSKKVKKRVKNAFVKEK
ncbi:MAG: cation-transporting P-type ATPase [Ruminococcaceae bacterium]|nr:cation-transporting P-type ATPase [Oscillospiraceae bacterium]